jgi:hypothetical protein
MRTLHTSITGKGLAVTALFSAATVGHAQPGSVPDYSRNHPLFEVSARLEARYARPVTFEGPLQVWRGEMQSLGFTRDGTERLVSKAYSLVWPQDDPVFSAPAISVEVVRQALDVYHRQNPGRSRYKVLESPMGFHIVLAAAHDEAGVMRPVNSLLDTPVEVLSEMRTATEHVEALVQAVSQSTGIRFGEVWNFDWRYAANGYFLRSGLPAPKDRPYWVFEWGASEVTAREALIDLMEGSSTTLTWGLECWPDALRGNRQSCDFQMSPVGVAEKRKELFLDRCAKCQPIPK